MHYAAGQSGLQKLIFFLMHAKYTIILFTIKININFAIMTKYVKGYTGN